MKKYLIAASIVLSTLVPAANAIAADLLPPPPPVEHLRPSNYDWSGFYAGGWVGTACIDGTVTDNTAVVTYLNAGCGYKGGVVAGWNHQIDNIVFGVEGDWGMSNQIARNPDPTADFSFTLDSIATLRGRVGYAWDDTMLFVTAGGAYAHGDINGIISTTPNHITADQFGWTAGFGVEHAMTDSLRIRLDTLYTSLADAKYSGTCACNVTDHWGNEWETRLGVVWAF